MTRAHSKPQTAFAADLEIFCRHDWAYEPALERYSFFCTQLA